MEENKESAWAEPVVYQAVISVKIADFRAHSFTGVVLTDVTDSPAKVKKKLLEEMTQRYNQANMPAKIEIKQLKKQGATFSRYFRI